MRNAELPFRMEAPRFSERQNVVGDSIMTVRLRISEHKSIEDMFSEMSRLTRQGKLVEILP